jgi:hypothetical protein
MNRGFCDALPMWVDPILEVFTKWCDRFDSACMTRLFSHVVVYLTAIVHTRKGPSFMKRPLPRSLAGPIDKLATGRRMEYYNIGMGSIFCITSIWNII